MTDALRPPRTGLGHLAHRCRSQGAREMPDASTLHANISMLFKESTCSTAPPLPLLPGSMPSSAGGPSTARNPRLRRWTSSSSSVEDAGVRVVAMNLESQATQATWPRASGEPGAVQSWFVSDPEHTDRFRKSVASAIEAAGRLGCRVVHAMYGNRRLSAKPREQDALAVKHLGRAATAASGSSH
jgi:hydroxypyruvate isomerase